MGHNNGTPFKTKLLIMNNKTKLIDNIINLYCPFYLIY